jgi:phage antirepressor YoqD-like protein
MNELTTEKRMTTKEVANILGVSVETVRANGKELFPDLFVNGKTTYLNEVQCTAIKMKIEKHHNLQSTLEVMPKTNLEKQLLIKQAMILQNEIIAELQAENEKQKQLLLEQKADVEFSQTIQADETSCFSMAQVSQELKLPYGNITLFKKLRELKLLKENNTPYQQYADMGLFKVYPKVINNGETTKTILVTLVTQKGVAYINKKLKEVK